MLEPGTATEVSYVATDRDMANALGMGDDDSFPAVFSTSRMIALMELAAAQALKPLAKPGEMSVGVIVNIKHLAATPSNTSVSTKATFLGMEGKLYRFRVEAFDPGGKIGEGEHSRAIVSTERLVQGARSRLDGKR